MKYIKLFEAFSKDYMKKIDLKDFKKIKKGAKLMYMGGKVEVLDNNGYVLKLKGEDDRIFMVNKSQFDHGGMTMRESVNELRSDMISGTSGRRIESLEDRKYELKKDVKGARIGDFVNVLLPKGTIIYNLPGGVFADHFSLKQKYSSRSSQGPRYFDKPTFKGISIRQMPDILAAIEKNSKVLESVNEAEFKHINKDEHAIKLAIKDVEKKARLKANRDKPLEYEQLSLNKIMLSKVLGREKLGKEHQAAWKKLKKEYSLKESIVTEGKSYQEKFKEEDATYQEMINDPSKRVYDMVDFAQFTTGGMTQKQWEMFMYGRYKKDLQSKDTKIKEKMYKVLNKWLGESVTESSSKDGGDKSNGNSHHDDHTSKSIAQHWKDIYGEEFHSKYPAIAKIVKSRPGIDKRELKRIWDETYGENFEEQYPALWQKMD